MGVGGTEVDADGLSGCRAYVLGCNAAGTHAGVPLAGLSMVIDPQGEVLAEAGAAEEVLSVTIDPARVAAWRDAFPVLDDRVLR